MKEKLYTIDLTDAVKSGDECMMCWLERKLEQDSLEFVLGASYMENDIREATSRQGFCRHHTKMMFDYGNNLGNAWILKSRLEYMNREFQKQMEHYASGAPGKSGGFFAKLRRTDGSAGSSTGSIMGAGRSSQREGASAAENWLRSEEDHCYVCGRMQTVYERMLDTFVYMLRSDHGFAELLMNSKGFCMHHFADILRICDQKLTPKEKEEWIPKLGALMSQNLDRMQEDINWLIEKYDYRNEAADWRQSKDAVQRTMQKLTGGHPADPVFKNKK